MQYCMLSELNMFIAGVCSIPWCKIINHILLNVCIYVIMVVIRLHCVFVCIGGGGGGVGRWFLVVTYYLWVCRFLIGSTPFIF